MHTISGSVLVLANLAGFWRIFEGLRVKVKVCVFLLIWGFCG